MSRIKDAEVPVEIAETMRNNLHRALYNNPDMAEAFAVLAKGVHAASSVPHRIRELAILRVVSHLKSDVEWAQHFRIAQMVGVSVEEALAIRDDNLGMFSAAERMAIVFSEMVDKCGVSDELWREASMYLKPTQLLDLVMVSGFYGYASRITKAIGVKVDDGLKSIAES